MAELPFLRQDEKLGPPNLQKKTLLATACSKHDAQKERRTRIPFSGAY
jgi:hypothetical protein